MKSTFEYSENLSEIGLPAIAYVDSLNSDFDGNIQFLRFKRPKFKARDCSIFEEQDALDPD